MAEDFWYQMDMRLRARRTDSIVPLSRVTGFHKELKSLGE